MSRILVPIELYNILYSTWEISLMPTERIRHYPDWRDHVCDFWVKKGYTLYCGPNNSWSLPDEQLIMCLLIYSS